MRISTVGGRLTSHVSDFVAAEFIPAASLNGQIFSTWPNSNSTGVARPKIDTATFTRERASSTSSTTPLNEAKGPSDTRTCSPTSNETEGLGRSMPSCT